MKRLIAIAAVASSLAPSLALPHHGWSEYDGTKTLKLSGKILESGYEHPHGYVKLDSGGKIWQVVLAPPSRMEFRGLSKDSIKPGGSVTVEGYQNRGKPEELRAERIIADGKTVELR